MFESMTLADLEELGVRPDLADLPSHADYPKTAMPPLLAIEEEDLGVATDATLTPDGEAPVAQQWRKIKFPVCDICQRLGVWEHPAGGVRCGTCARPSLEALADEVLGPPIKLTKVAKTRRVKHVDVVAERAPLKVIAAKVVVAAKVKAKPAVDTQKQAVIAWFMAKKSMESAVTKFPTVSKGTLSAIKANVTRGAYK